MKFSTLVTSASLLLLAMTAAASANVIYDVNLQRLVPSVTGTITTDGNIGVLGSSDIIAIDLTLSSGRTFTQLSNLSGDSLTATASAIYFDFTPMSGPVGDLKLIDQEGFFELCGVGDCNTFVGFCLGTGGSGGCTLTSGTVLIATAATAVPEPRTIALFAAGLLALGAFGWRRQRLRRS